jgi:small subunit ribosomal protein S21
VVQGNKFTTKVEKNMTMVNKKHRNESFESLMRRFKKLYEKSDILNEVKKRESFQKRSLTNRRAYEMAVKKEQKRQEDENRKRPPA